MSDKLTPEQAAALMKMRARETDPNKVLPTDSYGTTAVKAVKNIPKSALNLIQGFADMVQHPVDTANNIMDLGAGTLEAGLDKVGLAKPLNDLGDYMGLPNDHGASKAMAQQAGADILDAVKHPVTTAANDPVNTLFTLMTLGSGALGKVPTLSKTATAGKLATTDEVVAALKNAKNAAYTDIRQHNGNFASSKIGDAMISAAEKEGYTPHSPLYESNSLAVDAIKRHQFDEPLSDIDRMRQEADIIKRQTQGLAPDNHIAGTMKSALDDYMQTNHPEAWSILNNAYKKNIMYKNTESMNNLLKSGKLASAVRGSEGQGIMKKISQTLDNMKKSKGLDPEVATKLQTILDMPREPTGLQALTERYKAALAGGAIGSMIGFPTLGALAGEGLRAANDARKSRNVTSALEKAIREQGGLPTELPKGKLKLDSKNVNRAVPIGAFLLNQFGGGGW